MTILNPAALTRLQDDVRRRLESSPGCHDWDHTVRVTAAALHLAEGEGADVAVVECAALLHDIGRATESSDGETCCHAEQGAGQVAEILRGVGIDDPAFIEHVADCVRSHRYRKREACPPATREARVVYDADKLDSLGAIGIGRAFHFAGRVGARVHNTEPEALQSGAYSREDTAYREYLVKLRNLHESMLTPTGRRLAAARHDFMKTFFTRLDAEVHGQ